MHTIMFKFTLLLFVAVSATSFATSAYSNEYYLDPINGSINNDGSEKHPWPSLKEVIESNNIDSNRTITPYNKNQEELIPINVKGQIKPGSKLILRNGFHGDIEIKNIVNDKKITIVAEDGHVPIIGSLSIIGSKGWIFEGLTINNKASNLEILRNRTLVFIESHKWFGPSSDIVLDGNNIYSAESVELWSIDDWNTKAVSGLRSTGINIVVQNNTIKNVQFGITMEGKNSVIKKNKIINFSGDAIRVLGDDSTIDGNVIANAFKVDENHDDALQSWAPNKVVGVNNLVISNNYFFTDYNHPNKDLLSNFQGIGLFDGFYNNLRIENNLLFVNHWHAISVYGGNDVVIANNTVIDPFPDDEMVPWIKIRAHKSGKFGKNNNIINNIASKVIYNEEGVFYANNIELRADQYYNFFIDHVRYDFTPNRTSDAVDGGINLPEIIQSKYDISGNCRDNYPDVGAYEFRSRPIITPQY